MHEEAEKGGEQGQGLVWDACSMPQSCHLSPEGNALSFFYLFNSFFSISYHLTKKKEERKKKKLFSEDTAHDESYLCPSTPPLLKMKTSI